MAEGAGATGRAVSSLDAPAGFSERRAPGFRIGGADAKDLYRIFCSSDKSSTNIYATTTLSITRALVNEQKVPNTTLIPTRDDGKKYKYNRKSCCVWEKYLKIQIDGVESRRVVTELPGRALPLNLLRVETLKGLDSYPAVDLKDPLLGYLPLVWRKSLPTVT